MENFTFKIKRIKFQYEFEYVKNLPSDFDFTDKLVTRLGTNYTAKIMLSHYETKIYPYRFKEHNEKEGFSSGVFNKEYLDRENFYLLVRIQDHEI